LRPRPTLLWNVRCGVMDMKRYGLLSMWTKGLLPRLSSVPSAVVINSRTGVDVHREFGYHPHRWEMIPNGFDTDLFRPDPEARASVRREIGIPEESILIGLIARFDPMKGHDLFMRAASLIDDPHVHFILIGDGTEALRPVAEAAGMPGARSFFLGRRNDIPRLTAALDIACSSSSGEGFPNTVGEAMASGVPCVVTDVGDSAWVVGSTGVVVPSRDPEQFAAELAALAADSARRARLGAEARERIVSEFSLDAIVKRYEELYASFDRDHRG
jgi:glycosyltransferase involved in cell wall biosynthesis